MNPSLEHLNLTVEKLVEKANIFMDKYETSSDSKQRADLLHMAYGTLYREVPFIAGIDCDPSYIPEAESSRLRFLSLVSVPRFKEDEKICSVYIF